MGHFYGAFTMFLKLDRSEMSLWNHKLSLCAKELHDFSDFFYFVCHRKNISIRVWNKLIPCNMASLHSILIIDRMFSFVCHAERRL